MLVPRMCGRISHGCNQPPLLTINQIYGAGQTMTFARIRFDKKKGKYGIEICGNRYIRFTGVRDWRERGNVSECLPQSQAEGVTVPALGDIGAEIHMIFLGQ